MDEKSFYQKIWEVSLSRTRQEYSDKMEWKRLFLTFLFVILILIVLIGAGLWNRYGDIPSFIWGLFSVDILAILANVFFVPIIAYKNMWNIAAEMDLRQKDEIISLRDSIASWEDRFSSKKIVVSEPYAKVVLSNGDSELRPIFKNDSSFPMAGYYALIEGLGYAQNHGDEAKLISNLPKGVFHLVFPGEGAKAYRTEPIPAGDVFAISIARLYNNQNFFTFSTKESYSNNRFIESGYYFAFIMVGGGFNGIGIRKRIAIVFNSSLDKIRAALPLSKTAPW